MSRSQNLGAGADAILMFITVFGTSIALFGWRPSRPSVPRPWAVRAIAVVGCLALAFLAIGDESLSDAVVAGVVFVAIAGAVTSLYVQRPTKA